MNEKAYWTHEIAKFLDVSDSTLRKWSIELEKQDYDFIKNENGSRAYLVRDRELLTQLKQHLRTVGGTVEKAVEQALRELDNLPSNALRTPTNALERGAFEHEFEELKERLDKQEKFNQMLLKKMDQRDENLMLVLKEMQETRKQIAATNEKKPWWSFWK